MKKAALSYGLVALLAAAYLYPFIRVFSDAPDYGVFLNGADLLNHGAIPSRDFVEPQGPGSFVWLAMFFRLFGTTLATARGVLSATGIGMTLLAVYLSRKLGALGIGAGLFVLTISIPLMPINSPHYDSNLFALAALSVFLVAWDQAMKAEAPAIWKLVTAALLCGVMTWMIQQKGLYLLLAMLLSLLWLMRGKAVRPVLIMCLTYGAIVSLPFVVFASMHALPDVIYANYIWPLTRYSELNAAPYGFPVWNDFHLSLLSFTTNAPFILVAALPLLAPLAAKFSLRLLPYWLSAYALWLGELHRLDMGHLRNGVILLAVLFFSTCEISNSIVWRRIGLVATMLIVIAGATNLRGILQTGPAIETRRGEIHSLTDVPLIAFLELQTKPGDEVFIYPYQPIYYFVEKLRNPTRYSYMQYHLHTDLQFHEATQDLEKKQVRYVVFDRLLSGENLVQIFPAYRQPDKSKLIMEPYLDTHYHLFKDLGRFRILERNCCQNRNAQSK